MLVQIALFVASVWSSEALPRPAEPPRTADPKQVLYLSQRQQYAPELYDVALLEPQFQVPAYSFGADKQPFPSVQPQIILYHSNAPGQPFLLQPGSPPGNFLVPQGPNVIIRDGALPAPQPPRPVFVAGYPKPAHIPPIEKDAEEVPTNPDKIPPFKKDEKKPEKLETFNEDEIPKKTATEADVLEESDRKPSFNPSFNPKTNLRPGQRFFILNGQPLFSSFAYNNQLYPQINPNVNFRVAQHPSNVLPQNAPKDPSFQTPLFRSETPNFANNFPQNYPDNLVLLNQPGSFQDGIFRSSLPVNSEDNKDNIQPRHGDDDAFRIFLKDEEAPQEDDTVVIEAREQEPDKNNEDKETEVVAAADKPSEPTISQAQPGAIALAGPGGVAAASPRGSAFVGKDGVAVSSPQATAVAGPKREEPEEKDKTPIKKKP